MFDACFLKVFVLVALFLFLALHVVGLSKNQIFLDTDIFCGVEKSDWGV